MKRKLIWRAIYYQVRSRQDFSFYLQEKRYGWHQVRLVGSREWATIWTSFRNSQLFENLQPEDCFLDSSWWQNRQQGVHFYVWILFQECICLLVGTILLLLTIFFLFIRWRRSGRICCCIMMGWRCRSGFGLFLWAGCFFLAICPADGDRRLLLFSILTRFCWRCLWISLLFLCFGRTSSNMWNWRCFSLDRDVFWYFRTVLLVVSGRWIWGWLWGFILGCCWFYPWDGRGNASSLFGILCVFRLLLCGGLVLSCFLGGLGLGRSGGIFRLWSILREVFLREGGWRFTKGRDDFDVESRCSWWNLLLHLINFDWERRESAVVRATLLFHEEMHFGHEGDNRESCRLTRHHFYDWKFLILRFMGFGINWRAFPLWFLVGYFS